MSKGIRRILFWIGIFCFSAYKVFSPDALDPYFYDVCSIDYIDRKVEGEFEKKFNSKRKQQELADIKQRLVEAGVAHENVDPAIKTTISINFLKQNQCSIPKNIEHDFFKYLDLVKKAGDKNCPKDMFLKKNQEVLSEIKKEKVLYKASEDKIYNLLASKIKNKNSKNTLDIKWKEQNYRDETIVSFLQAADREKNECTDIYLPIRKIMLDLL